MDRHMEHTFEGKLNYCESPECPGYVEPWDRDDAKDAADKVSMFWLLKSSGRSNVKED